jgi:hypothetical protein
MKQLAGVTVQVVAAAVVIRVVVTQVPSMIASPGKRGHGTHIPVSASVWKRTTALLPSCSTFEEMD